MTTPILFSDLAVDAPLPASTCGSEAEREQQLQQLAALCSRCRRCGLQRQRTQTVFFDGNPQARIMVIGEGPGQNEDLTGKPFVGKAGQLLDQMLGTIGLSRQENVYICNIVKCRPPNNRAPEPEEMKACSGFLERQLVWVRPQIILLMGATALQGLTGEKQSISRSRGQWLQWHGIWCMPMFHPAYLLRNESRDKGSPKWQSWQDLKAVHSKAVELGLLV